VEDAEFLIISYGCSARSARQLVEDRRLRGDRIGLLELQTLWPFPAHIVQQLSAGKKAVIVAEMNTGQVTASVKAAADDPDRVFLANRLDGQFITHYDIRNVLRLVQGKGV